MKKDFRYDESVENSKRRHALPPTGISGDWKFFERLLDVKKGKDPVFITKSTAKGR